MISMLVAMLMVAAGETCPPELIRLTPYESNPVFEGAGPGHWDEFIRERGWILREDDGYHLWYTGYSSGDNAMKLGYATSPDGIVWTRHPDNPIYTEHWVEDMTVVKQGDTYYMFAEGRNDEAHLLTSKDRVHWERRWRLDVRLTNGDPIPPGPYGTPTVVFEDGKWYLLYERNDEGIWVATSTDLKTWTNLQDEPVIRRGPEPYDTTMIALNQVVKRNGRYYATYHATCPENGSDRWTTCLASSPDLVHWEKYAGNPILGPDLSSAIYVPDGDAFRLYAMHRAVTLYLPKAK